MGRTKGGGAQRQKMPTAAQVGSLPVGIDGGEDEEHDGRDDRQGLAVG